MTESPDAPAAIAFGPFVLDRAAARLTRDGRALSLGPRPFALLSHLIGRAGQLVTKDSLLDAVWGHRHVSESVLKGAVNTLRTAIGDAAKAPQWIETVPRIGYRFIGASRPIAAALPATPASPSTAAATAMFGREADIPPLLALLDAHRLVTLAGSGGIGKTRLALELAALREPAAPDGVWFVRLDALPDGQALAATVARALRLSAEAAHGTESLVAALSSLSLLLVLDNCEHLLEAAATLVQALLAHAPGVRLLVTSQEPLALDAEQVWRVGPLGWPPADQLARAEQFGAVALFVQRVRARDPAFVLDERNRDIVCELCARLDGLPLALELAAARVPLLGVEGVHARLQERLAMLTQGPRDAAPRHRTLRAALEWSHALLSADQRAVLRRLAVFSGTMSLHAIEAVAADPGLQAWGVVDAVGALVDKSLLVAVNAGEPVPRRRRRAEGSVALPPPAPRLRMFDSIRSLAAEQLESAGELLPMRTRHARWMLALLQDADRCAHDMPALEWTAWLQPDVDNLRAALRHALQVDPELAVALFVHSVMFWQRAGLKHEATRWNEAVRPFVTPLLPAALRAGFAQAQGFLFVYGMRGRPAEAVAVLEVARDLHRGLADALNEYVDLYLLSHALLRVDPQTDLSALWQRMVSLEAPDWGLQRRRYARSIPATRMRDSGDTAGYRRFCIDELARSRSSGDSSAVWTWSHGLALAEHDGGHAERAIAVLQEAVQEIRSAGLLRAHPNVVALLASMLLEQGDPGLSLPAAREAVALLRVDGALWWMAGALPFAALAANRPEDAARVMGWADAGIERRGEPPGLFFARLRAGCEGRLLQALAPAVLQALRREGAALDEAAALALALGK